MRCPNCAADNPEGSKFCSGCGEEIVLQPLPPPSSPFDEDAPPQPGEPGAKMDPEDVASQAQQFFDPSMMQASSMSPPDPPPAEEGGGAFKEVELCTVCSGAFPIGDLLEFHGQLYCPLCKAREIKEQKSQAHAPVIPGNAAYPQDPSPYGAPPGQEEEYPQDDGYGYGYGQEGQGPPDHDHEPVMEHHTSERSRSKSVGSGTYMLFAGVIGGLILLLSIIVVVFLVMDPAGSSSPLPGEGGSKSTKPRPKPKPKPDPVKKDPDPNSGDPKNPDTVKKPGDKKDPVPPKDEVIQSYEARWFTGTYLGINKDIESIPQDCLVFISDNDQRVYILGLPDLYQEGQVYKFKFKPDRQFFKNAVVNEANIVTHPQKPEDMPSSNRDTTTRKPRYPRKNVILTLTDHSEIHGDILGDDGENYIIRERDGGGEIRISKSRIKRID